MWKKLLILLFCAKIIICSDINHMQLKVYLKIALLTAVLLSAGCISAYGQKVISRTDSLKIEKPRTADSLDVPGVKTDSLNASMPVPDSLGVSAEIVEPEGEAARKTGSGPIDRPAFSTARDSIIEDMERNIIYYFGDVTAKYGDLELKADYMAYDVDKNIVYARGTKDTINNTIIGMPEMKEGRNSYKMEEVFYNFTTRKARIKNMATEQQEGKLVGDNLKMMPDQSINISGGKYTVCDADHPHYYLRMTTAKIITKPERKTMFGPAYLVVEDVPLPLALPFGFVPNMPDRASGILIPSYGEETARGLYLKDFGYSFVIGDYLDLALTGDIYSYGSWAVRATSRYKKRYSFDGNVALNYSVDVVGDPESPNYSKSKNFGVQWSHSQDPKARPGTSFRASVNFSSPSNNRFNSHNINEGLQNQVSSSISYGKTWSGMSLSVNALHSQNSRDSSYTFTLPNITFNVNRFYPFKKKVRVGKEKFYEQISFSYNTTLQNKIKFTAKEFEMTKEFLDKFENGMTHNFSIGLPGFTVLKYLQFTPSVSYGMNWFFRDQHMEYNPETDKAETVRGSAFGTFGVTQEYSGSISMSTRIYGMFNFGRKSKIQAIRHMITPSISANFHPELGKKFNGYETFTWTDKNGVEHNEEYNRYAGGIYSPPAKGRNASLSFSFANNLEAKVKKNEKEMEELSEADRDNPKKNTKKVKLIDQLNISGSYNFLADSLRLSNIGINASTTVFGKLGVSGNMTLNPYSIDGKGQTINTLCVIKDHKLARITNASASLSYSFNGGENFKGNDGKDESGTSGGHSDYYRVYYHPVTGEYIPGGWVYYLNPNVPWSVSLNYSFSYSQRYKMEGEKLVKNNQITQTLGVSAQVQIHKALKFSINTGFDISELKLSTTQVSASYDLHCFNIAVSWVPNGQWESWSFRIAANASTLSDLLKFKKSSSYWDK